MHSLLMDNWTLQNAGELICQGFDGDTAHDLVFTADGKHDLAKRGTACIRKIQTATNSSRSVCK